MDNFEYRNGALFAEDVAISTIAEEFGTPAYIYSRDALERAYLAYAQALEGHDALVCYAVKANSNIAVLNVLARLGAGFDIVSEGELERVLQAGGQAEKIVFSGVAKRESEMRRALEVGIHCFNIESEAELDRLNSVAESMGKVAPISLRVNPDVDAGTHPYISTGLKDNKFGVAIEDAARIYAYANSLSHLNIQGLDCHIGSQLTETAPFIDALDRLLVLIDTLAEQGITIHHLDLGGGLGVCYTDEVPPTPQAYIAEVLAKLGDRPLKLVFEPGRSIAANAGLLITKIEFLKCAEYKNFAIIDAAMNDMIRPSLYSAYMDIIPAQVRDTGESRVYDLVGPVCETGDFLGKERELNIQPGDLLAVCSAGAYGFTMSSNYNSRNRAAEVMVDDNQVHLIRQRETLADQLRGEQLLP
ncbi:diaminopimelate decarboxylase [Aliamphritea ceti]|uniref:diaminopimelate decarboxylase n=1 Tax=Aliamphritea ceti TaxID=1524258 RepID=UPI0021C4AFF6|nr:diaminopimelate decarboxylase [Aliamphritea ceti]